MKKRVSKPAPSVPKAFSSPITLSVDIGGTGIKTMPLDTSGNPVSESFRALTAPDPTPDRVLAILDDLRAQIPAFDRVSVGFPGVVKNGVTLAAHNLSPKWAGFPLQETLEEHWKKIVRVPNDASVQGYGATYGKGVELCLTLGTGLGSSLFTDGRLCPGLELAHHPWRKDKTYEDFLGRRGLDKYGKKHWNKFVQDAIVQTQKLFNWDHLYLGGGNTKKLDFKLPPNVSIVSNEDGILGGVALWN